MSKSPSGQGEAGVRTTPYDKTDSVFRCHSCSAEYKSRTSLNRHVRKCDPSVLVKCPTCDDGFTTEYGMKQHHTKVHGESISFATVACAWCGEEREERPVTIERYSRFFCDNECRGKWQSENVHGEKHPTWNGGKVSVECHWCGDTRKMWPAHAEGSERHFCSDTGCFGEWVSDTFSGEDSPRWAGGYEPYYGPDWYSQRRKAVERDDHTCQACGAHRDGLDRDVHVHHITPVREFDDPNDAHYLDNLVTLCNSCHSKWEGLYLRPDPR